MDFYFWLRFKGLDTKAGTTAFVKILFNKEVEAFCLELFNKKSVLLLPGNKMDCDNKHFRIGLGVAELKTGLDLFQEFTDENKDDYLRTSQYRMKIS